MEITVVQGTGRGPTRTAAYDAALLAAGVGNYNLITVSSVIPADASVTVHETAPSLGAAGDRLTVVQGKRVVGPATDEPAVAGLGWATGPDAGLFYEASGTEPATVRERITTGLAAGRAARDWTFTDQATLLSDPVRSGEEEWAAAVAVAAYGDGESL